jgi:predicted O-methyltransferase YrrM
MKPITDLPFSNDFLTSKEHFWNCKTPKELELCHKAGRGDKDHDVLLSIAQNNKKLFRLIATFVPTVDGWATPSKACALAALAMVMKPNLIVEIGVFGGRSLIPMALAIQENGIGKVVGIDPYSQEASAAEEIGQSEQWWRELDHEAILKKFQYYVTSFKLDSVVHLIRQKSDDVDPPSNIDILHIDGGHTEVAVRDAERYGPKVKLGGIAVCDDVRWAGGAVLRAIDTLEEMGFKECYTIRQATAEGSDDWMMLQRIKT